MFFDWTYLLIVVVPGMILGLWAQAKVHSAYARASEIPNRRRLTGGEIAQRILASAGIRDVRVEPTHGFLSDHYHPMARALRLSEKNYSGTSLAAAGVSAHEAGHALQHAQRYFPLQVRSAMVPLTIGGQWIGQLAMLAGFFLLWAHPALGRQLLVWALLGYGVVFLFTVVTLPVEFNASRRAMTVLAGTGILDPDELPEARRVLDAAALTYVASAVQVLLVLVYLFSVLNRRN